jgi:hypothetical protein
MEAAMKYEIREGTGSGRWMGRVSARTVDDAGDIYARRIHGRRVIGRRVTGRMGMSGCFQAYVEVGRAESSIGDQFHVSLESAS